MNRLLIVEDERNIAMGLKDDLELEGYQVEVTGSGKQAQQMVEQDGYDLILLDLRLPDKDGYEICRELRRAGNDVSIIMLTARAEESDKILGLDLGADDYVTKPFNPMELRARIRAVLRRHAAHHPELIEFGDYELDTARMELRKQGRTIELSPTEFKLLVILAKHPGRVFSREQLLDGAWGSNVFVMERTVDTHISNLRKKIEPDPSHPTIIVSIRGMGYRFEGLEERPDDAES